MVKYLLGAMAWHVRVVQIQVGWQKQHQLGSKILSSISETIVAEIHHLINIIVHQTTQRMEPFRAGMPSSAHTTTYHLILPTTLLPTAPSKNNVNHSLF